MVFSLRVVFVGGGFFWGWFLLGVVFVGGGFCWGVTGELFELVVNVGVVVDVA